MRKHQKDNFGAYYLKRRSKAGGFTNDKVIKVNERITCDLRMDPVYREDHHEELCWAD